MKKESVPKSKTNKKKSGLKWEYHEKFKIILLPNIIYSLRIMEIYNIIYII